jgi:PRTRC genetic system protein E
MTIFQELYALASTATLTMIISADDKAGRMTISVLPKPRKECGEVALTKDLTLTATPAEFDAEFVQALRGYQASRLSLSEQVEATNEVLAAAKAALAKKATEAVAKASKPTTTHKASVPAKPHKETDDEDGGEGDNNDDTDNDGEATDAEPAQGETLSLFG